MNRQIFKQTIHFEEKFKINQKPYKAYIDDI